MSSALFLPNFSDAFAADNCSVKTNYGIFDGFIDNRGVKTFLGIPYALPPVKNRRWRAPEPLKPSNKHFSAKNFGFSAMQDEDETEDASFNKKSEDCLTLNVWTRSSAKNLPVMVFIHGGGFCSGGSSDPIYNLSAFAANFDAIFVSINYRLNIFGFMNFANVDSDYFDTGYLGIKDQIAALTWIKENISAFGGNPDNITIFGESAGATSVMLLMIAPAAKNLFQKAIAQSGNLAMYHTPEESIKLANEFMNLGGYKNIRELLTLSAEKLTNTYEKLIEERQFITEVDYFPTCDGKFLPLHPLAALKSGAASGIKLLTGNMADEYRYWNLYSEEFADNLKIFHEEINSIVYEGEIGKIHEIYEAWSKNHAENSDYLEFANQLDWRVGQELSAEYQSAFDDVYFYLFSQKSPNELLGSCHAVDLSFVFGNPSEDIEPNPDPKLIKEVQTAWFNFAATGNPNNNLIPTWEKYSAKNRQTMEINSAFWTCHKDLNTKNLAELRNVYENYLLD